MKPKAGNNILDLASRRAETREQLLARLFQEHRAALNGFLRARILSPSDVDDVIQEVFLKLAAMPDLNQRLAPATGSNRAFLLTLANNLMVDMERHKAARPLCSGDYGLRDGETGPEGTLEITPETIAQADEALTIVRHAIMNLRPKWRRAFVLNRFQHKSYSQIAVEMGVSVKQVEKYMSKALAGIRLAARVAEGADKTEAGGR